MTTIDEFTQITCCNCGVVFALNTIYYNLRKNDNGIFCCPNGHTQGFVKDENSKDIQIKNLKIDLKKLEQELSIAKQELEVWKPRSTTDIPLGKKTVGQS